MSESLRKLLQSDGATLDQVLTIISAGVDPLYENGDTVVEALEKFGVKTLKAWYNEETSITFLASRVRARKMADAVISRWEHHQEIKSVEVMITRDGRENKKHSTAYLYILRTALVRNWRELALVMAESILRHRHVVRRHRHRLRED